MEVLTCSMELTNGDTPPGGKAMRRASPQVEDPSNYVRGLRMENSNWVSNDVL